MDYVLITTAHRGVFAGLLKQDDGEIVTLTEARNCIYWDSKVKGFIGLSVTGPTSKCRIGPAASEIRLYGVTSVTKCSDAARKAWEAAPWK
jgi:hypothetical protein